MLKRILLPVIACAAFLSAGTALAAEITILSVVGYWYDPVDNQAGVQAGDPAITNGDPGNPISIILRHHSVSEVTDG